MQTVAAAAAWSQIPAIANSQAADMVETPALALTERLVDWPDSPDMVVEAG
jgi:hypothetical protein